ncbi:SpaA isopeptide-forming pilin-related protein [Streptococcus dysgalactiae]|uniref:SpaA isopeptide-forming pilin-related protein n=1 Tax=Streptococcus dysgalactiae TaxID=1334 RepID=UPI000617F3B2|nr:SpaA isopeptide-forming pilin-related protein [Streptococcus dysgalactiae]KKC22814.1 collagen-binding protein [Streptococcus dysgalactiae subsp. equisimilis]
MKQTLKFMVSFLVMLGTMFGISQTVLAQGTHQLTIVHLEARDIDRPYPQLDIAPKEGTPTEGVLYQLYQLKSTEDGDLLAHWNSLTITELKKQAQQVFEATTDHQGKAIFSQLPEGIYYGLAVKNGEKNRNVSAFLVDLSEDKVIYPKIIWSTGELDLLKVGVDGDTKKPLAGVVFELYEKNGRTPIRVKNGVHSQDIDAAKRLETDSSGHIRISGLIPGDYVLKEIKTQSGYQIEQSETAVTIEKSKTVTVTIKNQKMPSPKVPPRGGFIPETGEQQAIILVIIGGILIALALRLLSKHRKNQDKH